MSCEQHSEQIQAENMQCFMCSIAVFRNKSSFLKTDLYSFIQTIGNAVILRRYHCYQ